LIHKSFKKAMNPDRYRRIHSEDLDFLDGNFAWTTCMKREAADVAEATVVPNPADVAEHAEMADMC
jgi:hypothetical protein